MGSLAIIWAPDVEAFRAGAQLVIFGAFLAVSCFLAVAVVRRVLGV